MKKRNRFCIGYAFFISAINNKAFSLQHFAEFHLFPVWSFYCKELHAVFPERKAFDL